jgi:hypothetical protein
MTETQQKATINTPYQYGQEPRKMEDWSKMQLQRFLMLGINPQSCDVVVLVTYQVLNTLNSWWLNRKR